MTELNRSARILPAAAPSASEKRRVNANCCGFELKICCGRRVRRRSRSNAGGQDACAPSLKGIAEIQRCLFICLRIIS